MLECVAVAGKVGIVSCLWDCAERMCLCHDGEEGDGTESHFILFLLSKQFPDYSRCDRAMVLLARRVECRVELAAVVFSVERGAHNKSLQAFSIAKVGTRYVAFDLRHHVRVLRWPLWF